MGRLVLRPAEVIEAENELRKVQDGKQPLQISWVAALLQVYIWYTAQGTVLHIVANKVESDHKKLFLAECFA